MKRDIQVGDKFILNLDKFDDGIPREMAGTIATVIFVPPDLAHPEAEYAVDNGYHFPWAVKVEHVEDILQSFKSDELHLI